MPQYRITLENRTLNQRRVEEVTSNNLYSAIVQVIRNDMAQMTGAHEFIFEDFAELCGQIPISEDSIDGLTRKADDRSRHQLGAFEDAIIHAWVMADKANKRILYPAVKALASKFFW